ncbi:polysaccharide deacetylase family protein [Halosolutus amylolyticus]|uniref:Polysaccharide deacetylase family protein n=1 Tax=Halosolutus amylolyticus TaxID=2932267 RepID=A0ABD5PNX3_9EURY|nr:polysaccharide deacetylase family protein [Halosolutus amylolyticus]
MVGTATISIELELGWGLVRFDKMDKLSDDRTAETRYLSRLLDRCDEYDVPITFDVVGHLFHQDCDGEHGGPHDDDWWDADPGTSVSADPEFYAPDLIDDIRSRDVDHEICTHTYSHVECNRVEPRTVRWELDRAQRVHDAHGLPESTSIVPPRHSTPPTDALTDAGIRVKRVPHYDAEGQHRPSTRVQKLHEILLESYPAIEPERNDGVLETYSPEYTTLAVPFLQTGTYSPHPVYRSLPVRVRRRLHERKLRRGLAAAADDDSFVHYWCHLYDFANEQQWPQIESFVRHLAERRDAGAIRTLTMRELHEDAMSRRRSASGRGDWTDEHSRPTPHAEQPRQPDPATLSDPIESGR